MGLGKTIQLLAFLQHLKVRAELKSDGAAVAPTSVGSPTGSVRPPAINQS